MMTRTVSIPSTRALRTRTALLEAGLKLFAERSIDSVPIDDIVATAGVAKGSFFNHFADKHAFASTLSTKVRLAIEARVAEANADVTCPLERLTNGMLVVVNFALTERESSIVMLRGALSSTARDHPLNRGLRKDIDAAIASGEILETARTAGLLFWLGNCQMLMMNMIEKQPSRIEAATRMRDIMSMALTGLGVARATSETLTQNCYERLIAPDASSG